MKALSNWMPPSGVDTETSLAAPVWVNVATGAEANTKNWCPTVGACLVRRFKSRTAFSLHFYHHLGG